MNDLSVQVDNAVTGAAGQFVSTLSQYKWDLLPDSQLHAAKKALTKNDYIMKIAAGNPGAVHDALLQSAILGLDLTEGKRQGWLLPRKSQIKDAKGNAITTIHLQVGYKGVEAIHQRMGVIDRLGITVIREGDTFDWSGYDHEKPKHVGDWLSKNREKSPISGVFSITYFPDKSIQVKVVGITEIYENHRDRSDSYKSYIQKKKEGKYAHPSPWISDEKAMVEKTMAFIASKQWPANIRNQGQSSKILETLHEVDTSDYSYGYTQEQKKAFYVFIENDDALGMYLFVDYVGIEVYSALTLGQSKCYQKGEKVAMKQKQNDFVDIGRRMFSEIKAGIAEEDVNKIQENMDGTLVTTEKLLLKALSKDEAEQYKRLMDTLPDEVNKLGFFKSLKNKITGE